MRVPHPSFRDRPPGRGLRVCRKYQSNTIAPAFTAQRDSRRSRVVVQVVGEADVLQLDFDDVAEYLGDAHADDW